MTWLNGDVSGSQTLTDNDSLYASHINELRSASDVFYGRTEHVVTAGAGKADYSFASYSSPQAAINAAVTAMSAQGGGVVQLKDETVTTTGIIFLKNNVWLRGVGVGKTILRPSVAIGVNSVLYFTGSVGAPLTNCRLSDFEIDGINMPTSPVSYQTKGINIFYSSRLVIDNLYIHDTPASGLGPDNNVDCLVSNTVVERCGTVASNPGFNAFGFGIGGQADENVTFVNCIAKDSSNNGFLLEYVAGGNNSRHFTFVNCIASGCKRGFRSSGGSNTGFINCQAYNCTTNGFFIQQFGPANDIPENVKMIGCEAYDNGDDGISFKDQEEDQINIIAIGNHSYSNAGDGIVAGGKYAQLKDNVCWNNDNDGINYHVNSAGTAGDAQVSGNICYNNGQAGVSGRSDGIRISGDLGPIPSVIVSNNHCFDNQATPTQFFGIAFKDFVSNAICSGNICHDNNGTGIYYEVLNAAAANTDLNVTNNICYNNGRASASTQADGIRISSSAGSVVGVHLSGNRCYDNQTPKTQQYGIAIKANVSEAQVINNDLRGNLTDAILSGSTASSPANNTFTNNKGWNPHQIYAQGNVTGATTFNRVNGDFITATLTGNVTATLTAGKNSGDRLTLELIQDATGSRTMTWPSNFKKAGGTLTLTTAANAKDLVNARWDGSNWIEVSRSLNVS